ncbi:MAG: ATP-binding cassette domain-containing protein [Altererythrobacter sp.]|nr:ATP-binding cassette domain-containing protein [Altererythrobacter sp.]NNF93347.1 ATP-binding cassette domain-containing protein [Altererythrobacter sp.]NNK46398.1 ATP-binding cassette domain-containing protein [Altererythrobacter sp.]
MILCADNISLSRGARLVLDQVSVRLAPGKITAICGPNGAGKSSLLMALAGLLEPSVGRTMLAENELSALHPQIRAQRIGYLPQEAEVAWDVAVENLVRLGRMPYRDRGDHAVEAAITALDLETLRHRPASRLSGGEKARALLARVLAGEPQWILADEPLAALDLAHQQTLLRHLRKAAQAGAGVVIVVHDLATAMNHADRVLVLREGRVVSDGSPDDALSPQNIANGWGVEAGWIGETGARALVV